MIERYVSVIIPSATVGLILSTAFSFDMAILAAIVVFGIGLESTTNRK